MFVLSVVKDDERIELKKTRSQIEMDSFTTCFETDEALLNKLSISPEFEVKITESLKKDEEPMIIPFTGSVYRNMIYNFNSFDFFKKIVSLDNEILKKFFQNELLFQNKGNDRYSKDKNLEVRCILGTFRDENEEYVKRKLRGELSAYFRDYYSAFKRFYKYVNKFRDEEKLIYPVGTRAKCEEELAKMRDIISKVDKKEEKEYEFEDDVDSISTNPLSDVDDKVSELDIYLDDQGISEEEKKDLIDKKKKKIIK